MPKLAIIGSGIAGLGAAWFLHRDFDLTVFEAEAHVGGHSNTVTVEEEGREVPIDTGFMVFNHVTYPNLLRLFNLLGVPTKRTDMSFSVRHVGRELEFCGSSLNHLFAQRRNLLSPAFYRMLWQIDRFNREALAALDDPSTQALTLAEYVERGRYGDDFFSLYLLPMSSAVWSTPPHEMLRFPATTLLRFFHNHGFLGLHTQHPWWTVEGGSRSYVTRLIAPFRQRVIVRTPVRRVRRMADGVYVQTKDAEYRFDRVIMACHPPTAIDLLGSDITREEYRTLAAFRYRPNTVTLHTDERVMPRTRLAWSAWNYRLDLPADLAASAAPAAQSTLQASTHYWMNRLQGVSRRVNYFVSVGDQERIASGRILRTIPCEHPLFDLAARDAQASVTALNSGAVGRSETYFAGAWQRYGFHEDGLMSAIDVATLLLGRDPWPQP